MTTSAFHKSKTLDNKYVRIAMIFSRVELLHLFFFLFFFSYFVFNILCEKYYIGCRCLEMKLGKGLMEECTRAWIWRMEILLQSSKCLLRTLLRRILTLLWSLFSFEALKCCILFFFSYSRLGISDIYMYIQSASDSPEL